MASDDLDLNDLASDDEKDIKINKTISKNLSKRGQLPKIVDKDSNNDNSEDDFDLDDDEDDFENEDEESDIDLENSDEDVDEIDDDEEVVKVQPIKDNKKGTTLTPQKLNTKLAKEQPNNATNKRKQEAMELISSYMNSRSENRSICRLLCNWGCSKYN
ncbi:putative uncharacterized protein DDB_G0272194 [Gordionus sp. m RMFG-2023]|uniref:putative uncharacterized protein DDB_G0272194 n=1 Tax=Gordionus sp. m RMFG-2023 TaxID=3053472 RepID=UPI0031FD1E31